MKLCFDLCCCLQCSLKLIQFSLQQQRQQKDHLETLGAGKLSVATLNCYHLQMSSFYGDMLYLGT